MDTKKFQLIKNHYQQFYRSLLQEGRLPMRSTEAGFWNSSPAEPVFELFNKIALHKFSHFLDIGSGDGSVTLIASLFTKATGIEIDPVLHQKAVEAMEGLNLDATFINDNYHNYPLSQHDIIFTAPDKPFYRSLEPKLMREMKGTLVVFGPVFQPQFLEKREEFFVDGILVGIYGNQKQ